VGDLDFTLGGFGAAPEPLLLLALAVDLLLPTGGRRGAFTGGLGSPFARLALVLAQRLHRPGRGANTSLFRGALVMFVVVGGAALLGAVVAFAVAAIPFAWIAEIALLVTTLAVRRPLEDTRALAAALGGPHYRDVAVTVLGAEAATLDEAALARAAASHLGRRLTASVLAPVFWFVLAGLPELLFAVAALAAARVLPEESPRFAEFCLAASRLRVAVLILPDVLAGLLVALASLAVPKAAVARAFAAMTSARNHHRLPGEAIAAAAFAGALDMPVPIHALAKAGDAAAPARWSGNAGAVLRAAAHADLRRASYLYGVTCVLVLGAVVLLVLARFAG
jgi:adenosylcobinamide-phosphate synthase